MAAPAAFGGLGTELPNDLVAIYGYDGLLRLTALSGTLFGGLTSSETFGYDAATNMKERHPERVFDAPHIHPHPVDHIRVLD